MENLVGRTLGRYELVELLGEGGMAAVYKGRDARLGRFVAVKVIRPGDLQSEQFLKRFDREARALASLNHPNIVDIHDYGEDSNIPYLVMEYLPGGTLKERMGRPLSPQQAARILLPIAEALAYAHQRKIIHRDIKPANILFDENNNPMLSDFGISKISEREQQGTELTGFGMGIGTPEYMAPEQSQGVNVDHRADIYAMGVVLYELVTGQKPFQADTPMGVVVKHISEPLPDPRTYIPSLPAPVTRTIFRSLEKKAVNRFKSMSEFAAELRQIASSAAGAATATLPEPVAPRQGPAGPAAPPPGRPASMPSMTPPPPEKAAKKSGGFLAFGSGILIASVIGVVLCIGIFGALYFIGSSNDTTPTPETVADATLESVIPTVPDIETPLAPTPTTEIQTRILMQDDFENQLSGWEVGNFTNGAVGYRSGAYFVEATEATMTIWGAANRNFSDLVIDVQTTQIAAPLDNNNDYGVACRVQENGDGYYLLISGDGFFSIFFGLDDSFSPLVDWQQSAIIQQGNASNHIQASCVGPSLELVVNDTLLAQVNDTTFTNGDIAFTATTYGDAPVEIHFDHLVVSEP